MNKTNTIEEIDNIITDITDMIYPCLNHLKESEHVYSSHIDQFIDKLKSVINGLEDARDNVLDDVYIELRAALKTDRQSVAEAIIYWQGQGEDLETMSTNLHTTTDVLVDLIDEFAKVR